MKKVILISFFAAASLPFNAHAANWKKIGWATTGIVSLAAIVPAIRSDLNAKQGTAQAEVPLFIIPICALLGSCIGYAEQCAQELSA